jgi:hypothetical protein
VTARLQPLIGPARDGRLDQRRRTERIAEGGDSRAQ